jgi:transposase
MEFRLILEKPPDHSKFHWLDEKHMVNKDAEATKVRADPLTGRIPCVHVNGDFRDGCNLFAIVSASPRKVSPVACSVGRDNGNAASFLAFIEFLLARNWFEHGDVLIMDNASIHAGQEVNIEDDLLWEAMQVLVAFLATRSPELNPIELVFHILSRRIRSHRFRQLAGACDQAVLNLSCQVLDDMSFNSMSRCCRHCGCES